jgi:hypothetical protein
MFATRRQRLCCSVRLEGLTTSRRKFYFISHSVFQTISNVEVMTGSDHFGGIWKEAMVI